MTYLCQRRIKGKYWHLQSAFCNFSYLIKVPYMYKKQKPYINNWSFSMQKQPLRGVLENRCSTTMIKTLEKCLRKISLSSKVAGCSTKILLRLNSFTGTVEHLFLSNTFSWLLLFITRSKQKSEPCYELSW